MYGREYRRYFYSGWELCQKGYQTHFLSRCLINGKRSFFLSRMYHFILLTPYVPYVWVYGKDMDNISGNIETTSKTCSSTRSVPYCTFTHTVRPSKRHQLILLMKTYINSRVWLWNWRTIWSVMYIVQYLPYIYTSEHKEMPRSHRFHPFLLDFRICEYCVL